LFKYRAVRRPNDMYWSIECFDTEFQVSYPVMMEDKSGVRKFLNKQIAETFIKNAYFTGKKDYDTGEVGDWISGTV